MKNKNFIAIVIVFVLLAIIRLKGIENIPFNLIVFILVICIVGMLISVGRFKGKKKERQMFIVMTLNITLLIAMVIIAVYIENNYPQLSEHVKPIFITLMAILFVTLLMVIFANALYKSNKIDDSKKK